MRYRNWLVLGLALGGAALASPASAANGHYVPGVEGLNGAMVPPPGLYYRGYLARYEIDSLRDGGGDAAPGRNRGEVTALVNRLVWITDRQILGADYGVEAILPVVDTSLRFGGVGLDDGDSGLGDLFLSPLVLGWHGERWDAVFAAGQWLDTGDHAADRPASPGKGFDSTMLTLGGAWHLDEARRWTVSALSRYETHGRQSDTGVTPGDSLVVEWGLGHRLASGLTLGLVGYDAWQLEDDSGAASGDKAEQHAIGVEAGVFWPALGLGLNAALYHEYDNRAAPQGDLLRLTLTQAF
ncbi:SphA family protein [Bisbaumannia pacifica]|uniref:Transporter n=1 Tax=Bisbaumannia pacifica TaxID=77098 RepID=A0ABD4L6P7_9GAMM|nr:transporter [Halomonas pacifica]MBH8581418.1 transporter [Halomonas pacifica]